MAGINLCRDCKNRHIGCHSNCEIYQKWIEHQEELKKRRYQTISKWKAGYYHDCK